MQTAEKIIPVKQLDIPLERDVFVRTLIRELSGLLEDVVGLQEAEGFISIVGQNIGNQINISYREALSQNSLNKAQVGEVLEDLKLRIQGEFQVAEVTDRKIVFRNTACPFGDKVLGRPSLCMMTSNVFGTIASENLGYAKVDLQKTIASGDSECLVTVYLDESDEADSSSGREYYGSEGP